MYWDSGAYMRIFAPSSGQIEEAAILKLNCVLSTLKIIDVAVHPATDIVHFSSLVVIFQAFKVNVQKN